MEELKSLARLRNKTNIEVCPPIIKLFLDSDKMLLWFYNSAALEEFGSAFTTSGRLGKSRHAHAYCLSIGHYCSRGGGLHITALAV